jgi:hypothetical protein
MDKEMDKGKKKEAMDPIMMEEDQINKIMEKVGKTHSGRPYQYKIYNKKRAIANREGLVSNEEEVEDIQAMEKIEEILRATYKRKIIGPVLGIEGRTPVQIIISVEPTNPCAINTPERTPKFRQPNFSRRGEIRQRSNQGQ